MMQTFLQAIAGVGRLRIAPAPNNRGFVHLWCEGGKFPMASGPMSFIRRQFEAQKG